ncbi:MAG: signal peptidase I [Acidobacteria bacterium]|nr:signal peptidase I [Acidobacteriota bacterium]
MTAKGKVLITVASVLLLALAVMAAYFLIYYRIISVPTGAMANTILPGDRVLCQMRIAEIKRGDIALFKLPADPRVFYLKRVIGLPGEMTQVRGVKVFIILIVGKALMIVDSTAAGGQERVFKRLE